MRLDFLLTGLFLGITAGLSPGPLMALVISETVKRGRIQGIKVSLAPLFTDIPLILLIIFVLKQIRNMEFLLGIISTAGSLFLFYLGYKDFKSDNVKLQIGDMESNSFKKGLLTNFLNPHPYVFWLFVGVPFMIKGNSLEKAVFVTSFSSVMDMPFSINFFTTPAFASSPMTYSVGPFTSQIFSPSLSCCCMQLSISCGVNLFASSLISFMSTSCFSIVNPKSEIRNLNLNNLSPPVALSSACKRALSLLFQKQYEPFR